MKLLEKLRALRSENNQHENVLLSHLQTNHYDYANENMIDSFGIGATTMQETTRYEFLEAMNLKCEASSFQ